MKWLKKTSGISKTLSFLLYSGCLYASTEGFLDTPIGSLSLVQHIMHTNKEVLRYYNTQERNKDFQKAQNNISDASLGGHDPAVNVHVDTQEHSAQLGDVAAANAAVAEDENKTSSNQSSQGRLEVAGGQKNLSKNIQIMQFLATQDMAEQNRSLPIAKLKKEDVQHMLGVGRLLQEVQSTSLGVMLHILNCASKNKRADKTALHLIGRPYWAVVYNVVYMSQIFQLAISGVGVVLNAIFQVLDQDRATVINLQRSTSILRQEFTYLSSLYTGIALNYLINRRVHDVSQYLFVTRSEQFITLVDGSRRKISNRTALHGLHKIFGRAQISGHAKKDVSNHRSVEHTLSQDNDLLLLKNIIAIDLLISAKRSVKEDEGFNLSCWNKPLLLGVCSALLTPLIPLLNFGVIAADTVININLENHVDPTHYDTLSSVLMVFKALESITNGLGVLQMFCAQKQRIITSMIESSALINELRDHIFFAHAYCVHKKSDEQVYVPDILLKKYPKLCDDEGRNRFHDTNASFSFDDMKDVAERAKEKEERRRNKRKREMNRFFCGYARNIITLFKYLTHDDFVCLSSALDKFPIMGNMHVVTRIDYIVAYIKSGGSVEYEVSDGESSISGSGSAEVLGSMEWLLEYDSDGAGSGSGNCSGDGGGTGEGDGYEHDCNYEYDSVQRLTSPARASCHRATAGDVSVESLSTIEVSNEVDGRGGIGKS